MKNLPVRFMKSAFWAVLILLTSLDLQAAALTYRVLDASLIRVISPTNSVIRTQLEWQNFYRSATSHRFPQPAVPVIDFNTTTVVVVSSGEKATGGYKDLIASVTNITGATTSPSTYIDVRSVLINPGVGCFVSQSFTYPVALFTIPKTAKPFVFSKSNVYSTCN